MKKKVNENKFSCRALLKPETFSEDENTVQVVFASEAPYVRSGWNIGIDTPYNEVLLCDPKNIRMDRASQGLPVFDNHPWDMCASNQLGICTDIQFKNGQGMGTIHFGAQMTPEMKSDIKNGIIRSISVGYQIFKLERNDNEDSDYPTYQATDWEPLEVSFAPVPADTNAGTRKAESNNFIDINEKKMKIDEVKEKGTPEQRDRLSQIRYVTRKANLSEDTIQDLFDSKDSVEDIEKKYLETPKPSENIEDQIKEARSAATKEAGEMMDWTFERAKKAGVSIETAYGWIKENKSKEQITDLLLENFRKADPKIDNTSSSHLVIKMDIDKRKEGAVNAILHRACPAQFQDDPQNHFRGMSVVEIVKDLSAARGIDLSQKNKIEIADRVFKRDLSLSDLPLVLEDAQNKILNNALPSAQETWKPLGELVPFNDFRDMKFYDVDHTNGMEEVEEGGELKYTSLTDSKQTARLKKYGEAIRYTYEMFINDDLSFLSRIPSMFVKDWDLKQADLVWGLITGNKLSDGKAIFATGNNNVASSGGTISDETINNGFVAMQTQKSLGGTAIGVAPSFLIVPAALGMASRKQLAVIGATTTKDVNIWSGAFTLIVERRLTGNAWYMAADPMAIPGIKYGYLNGSGLRSNMENDFGHDAINYMVRGEFAASVVNYRGWYKNPGA